MKLLTEIQEKVKMTIVSESTDTNSSPTKTYYIEGKFIQLEKPNRNDRVYKAEFMDPEVERYIEQYVNKHRAFGELGHPDTPTINLDRVSHLITSLQKEGSDWNGRAKILDTPNGKIVKAFIDGGCVLGVSTRGLGSLQQEKQYNVVQSDYKIMTAADIVADPSAHEAFVEAIMESKEWIWDNGKVKEVTINDYRKKLEKAPLTEERIALFKDFLSKL
jgi:hypothetical protein